MMHLLLHSLFLFVKAFERLFVSPGRDVSIRLHVASKPEQRCRRSEGEIVWYLHSSSTSPSFSHLTKFYKPLKHRCACFAHTSQASHFRASPGGGGVSPNSNPWPCFCVPGPKYFFKPSSSQNPSPPPPPACRRPRAWWIKRREGRKKRI